MHGSGRVDRVKTADVRVERGSGGLGGQPVEDGGDTCRVAGDAYGVRYSRVVWWFGPQNHRWLVSRVWASKPGRGFEEKRTARGGIEEFASRRSYLMKGAVVVGYRLPRVGP
jgi:hypothetical protein